MRRLLKTSVLAHDYRHIDTDQGRLALEMAALRNPDLILLDLGLPDMDGLEVTFELRSWSRIPIIVSTDQKVIKSAASRWQCPASEVEVRQLSGDTYRVAGCDHEADYVCPQGDRHPEGQCLRVSGT